MVAPIVVALVVIASSFGSTVAVDAVAGDMIHPGSPVQPIENIGEQIRLLVGMETHARLSVERTYDVALTPRENQQLLGQQIAHMDREIALASREINQPSLDRILATRNAVLEEVKLQVPEAARGSIQRAIDAPPQVTAAPSAPPVPLPPIEDAVEAARTGRVPVRSQTGGR